MDLSTVSQFNSSSQGDDQFEKSMKKSQISTRIQIIDQELIFLEKELRVLYDRLSRVKNDEASLKEWYKQERTELLRQKSIIHKNEQKSGQGSGVIYDQIANIRKEGEEEKREVRSKFERAKSRAESYLNSRLEAIRRQKGEALSEQARRDLVLKTEIQNRKRDLSQMKFEEKSRIERERSDLKARLKVEIDQKKRQYSDELNRLNQEAEMMANRKIADSRRTNSDPLSLNRELNSVRVEKDTIKRTNTDSYNRKVSALDQEYRNKIRDIDNNAKISLRDIEEDYKESQTDFVSDLNLLKDDTDTMRRRFRSPLKGPQNRLMNKAYSSEREEEKAEINSDYNHKKRMAEEAYQKEIQQLENAMEEQLTQIDDMIDNRIKELQGQQMRITMETGSLSGEVLDEQYIKKRERQMEKDYNKRLNQYKEEIKRIGNKILNYRIDSAKLKNEKRDLMAKEQDESRLQTNIMNLTNEIPDPKYDQTRASDTPGDYDSEGASNAKSVKGSVDSDYEDAKLKKELSGD